MNLKHFVGENQLLVMRSACHGEEGEYFKKMIEDLKVKISTMPKTYETDGQGANAVAVLHYFKGGSDWYVIERDAGSPDDENQGDQIQAFGFACMNGDYQNAELGYISIQELIEYEVELDLYYKPETIKEIRARFEKRDADPLLDSALDNVAEWMDNGTCPALDGCMVELDGHCPHGSPSVVLNAGMI